MGLLGFFIAGLSSGLYQTYFLSDGVITTPFYYPVLLDSVDWSSTSAWVWDYISIESTGRFAIVCDPKITSK